MSYIEGTAENLLRKQLAEAKAEIQALQKQECPLCHEFTSFPLIDGHCQRCEHKIMVQEAFFSPLAVVSQEQPKPKPKP